MCVSPPLLNAHQPNSVLSTLTPAYLGTACNQARMHGVGTCDSFSCRQRGCCTATQVQMIMVRRKNAFLLETLRPLPQSGEEEKNWGGSHQNILAHNFYFFEKS